MGGCLVVASPQEPPTNMAKATLNPLLLEIRGRIGPVVFRQFKGRTVVQRAPDMSRVVPTPAQLAQRARFQQAAAHARAILADPALRARHAEQIGRAHV